MANDKSNECFVIMPISDPDGYEDGHFKCVYEDILKPAIEAAGFEAKRGDDNKSSSMIHVNIIKSIIEAPMAVCDLSSRNPNVLFELGIRQAFDLPVVLVQEKDTPRIFDIGTINTVDYRKELIYREVIEDREKIRAAIEETKDNKKGINSIIRLLEIGKAQVEKKDDYSDIDEIKTLLFALGNQIDSITKNMPVLKKSVSAKEIEYFEEYVRWVNIVSQLSKDTDTDSRKINDIIYDIQGTYKQLSLARDIDRETRELLVHGFDNLLGQLKWIKVHL